MTKQQIDEIKVGALIKFSSSSKSDADDMGLVSRIVERRPSGKLFFVMWGSSTSSETSHTLNRHCFELVQNAEAR